MFANQRISSYVIVITFFSTFLLSSFSLIAQAPESINYQAIARDLNGNVLDERTGTVTFKILSGSSSGTEVYEESHMVTTNSFGLFNVKIGEGVGIPGTLPFSAIDWGSNPHFLNVTIDFFGPEDLGTTELVSVPYALYAKSSGNRIVGGKGIQVFNNDSIVNTGDTSNTNELITKMELLNDTLLKISEGSQADSISLSALIKTDSLLLSPTGTSDLFNLAIIGGNQIQFSVADQDADEFNELQVLSLNGTGDSLILSNQGGGIALSSISSSDNQNLRLNGDTLFIDRGDSVNLNVFRDTAAINLTNRRIDT